MVSRISKPVIGLLIFATLISLLIGINSDFRNTYDLSDDYKQTMTIKGKTENRTIAESFGALNIISSLNSTAMAVHKIQAPDNPADLLGAMAATAIGAVTLIGSIVTLPFEIIGILTGFFTIPPVVPFLIVMILIILIGFKILSKLLGGGDL